MTDRRVLHQSIVSAAVAASVVALAVACSSITGGLGGGGGGGPLDCGDGSTANAAVAAGIFSDIADDYTFTPGQVTITAGQTVCWEIIDGVSHTITPVGGGTAFGGMIDANQRVLKDTFAVAGDYSYYCQMHMMQNMSGVVHVLP